MGLEAGNDLFRLFDDREQRVTLPPDGVMLSSKLAELLHARVGDLMTVEVMEADRPVRQVPVTAIFTEFSGTNAYMDIRALHRLLREEGQLCRESFWRSTTSRSARSMRR